MKRLWKKCVAVAGCLLVLGASVCLVSYFQQPAPNDVSESPADSGLITNSSECSAADAAPSQSSQQELRGVWIPCMTLQASEQERTENNYRKKMEAIMSDCEHRGLNTVIVQVRPFGDALYPSRFFPWSHILSGKQGVGVDFDPLQLIIEQAHAHKLAVHAWINPLRIKLGEAPDDFAETNPFVVWKNDKNTDNDHYTFTYEKGIYYDPSYPEVRQLIINGVRELGENYEIDGLQIDDYFYPSEEKSYDKESYRRYVKSVSKGSKTLSQEEWRENNINMLVAGIHAALKSTRSDAVFGIAPQGNLENNRLLSADVQSWCRIRGYADYLCPQLYVSMEHPLFPFEQLADQWIGLTKNTSIPVYFGLGLYKAGTDADSGTWLSHSSNIQEQIRSCRQKGADGFMLYDYDHLHAAGAEQEVENAMAEIPKNG